MIAGMSSKQDIQMEFGARFMKIKRKLYCIFSNVKSLYVRALNISCL